MLRRTAQALEGSAALADAHATRQEMAGRIDDAATGRLVAQRARAAAKRARSRVQELS